MNPGFNCGSIRALLVDIDDTIVCFKNGHDTDSLHSIFAAAGRDLAGLTVEETTRRLEKVKQAVKWWHWSDFIVELGLNPKQFWRYALERERAYVKPTGLEIAAALQRLRDAGFFLYVTSNNPSSGILHKLCVAGLGTLQGAPLFHQLLGATELHAMKWEKVYWQKVLAHIALDAGEVAVVGDNARDDYEVPRSIGIAHTFLLNRDKDLSAQDAPDLTHVTSFDQVADLLLSPFSTTQDFSHAAT